MSTTRRTTTPTVLALLSLIALLLALHRFRHDQGCQKGAFCLNKP